MKLFYDVIVVGGGHAGCEAACAAAGLGAKTCLVTMDMNKIAQMSCNPAIGGIAKGQIVREIDALGGRMGIVTDRTAIQFRMLNRSKGPAMWSPRAQCDRGKFIWEWRHQLDITPNLDIWQDQVEEILTSPLPASTRGGDVLNTSTHDDNSQSISNISSPRGGRVGATGVRTIWGVEIYARCVIITAGTFLNGLMHIGRTMLPGGRIAEPAALHLTESINALGIRSARMKTGTPVRIDARSVDYSLMERQDGEGLSRFSYMPEHFIFSSPRGGSLSAIAMRATKPSGEGAFGLEPLPCWTTNTNARCHEVLMSGINDSPLFNGQIQSTGPRYCPSVETKLVTFPDRDSHPLFLEPEGTDTNEMYLNGFSSSMPMDIQLAALKEIPAFRNLRIYRPGYAIEYDYFDPTQLYHTLESKLCDGLFFAGQVNGTTGYEEAAGQGIMAGINAALKAGHSASVLCGSAAECPSLVLNRDQAYIGVLIDDLVMKGVDEPYRMFTSRAEYRILLRQDDADRRLTPLSHNIGLATTDRYNLWKAKEAAINTLTDHLRATVVKPDVINPYLESIGSTPLHGSAHLSDLLARPGVTIEGLTTAGILTTTGIINATTPTNTPATIRPISDTNTPAANTPAANTPAANTPAANTPAPAPAIPDTEITEATEVLIKYDGYIRREREYANKMHRLEDIKIRGHFDYNSLQSLSTEARQKLTALQPKTLAQASRIPGVSPSDINVLLVLMGR